MPPPEFVPSRTPVFLAVAAYRFPHGDAMSNRLLQLARSATPPGAATVVVNDWPDDGSHPSPAHLPPDVRLITLHRAGKAGAIRRWLRRQQRPLRVLAALRRTGIRSRDLIGVHLPLGLWNLTTWAVLRSRMSCPVTVDVLERHDPQQFPHGRLTPYYVRHRWAFLLAGHLADRIIAISEALEGHFVRRGRPTLLVPPQVDCADFPPPSPPSLREGLRLVYAGTAGTKDRLAVVLEGIRQLPPAERSRVRLTIAGMTAEQATAVSDLDRRAVIDLTAQLDFLGRVTRERVIAELGRAHFSVLIRPTEGYARAGFPSKVPESLAAGCPVLLNHSSDLARHIEDGREGIVLAGPSADDMREGLVRALALDDEQWWRMSRQARKRATSFDYQSWRPKVSSHVTGWHTEPETSRAQCTPTP